MSGPGASGVFSNARLVLGEEVVNGSVRFEDGVISEVDTGGAAISGSIDCAGDFLSPGLVELHTDNLERHLQPRPGVSWPLNASVLSHDGELASVGISTVFDALRVGSIESDNKNRYKRYARPTTDAILELRQAGHLRISHFIHLRAEVCSETLLEELAEFSPSDRIGIVSLMDHTPGQRQFRNTKSLANFLSTKHGMSDEKIDDYFDDLKKLRARVGATHKEAAIRAGRQLGAILASHDDTTADDVIASKRAGVRIAEFPTTVEAAAKIHEAGIHLMMGAPNILRGGSHSGNVAAQELADNDLLDILSSDYAPSSLLIAAVQLGEQVDNLAKGLRRVTAAPAAAAGLGDRGTIEPGLRADLLRFGVVDGLPIVKGLWVRGERVS